MKMKKFIKEEGVCRLQVTLKKFIQLNNSAIFSHKITTNNMVQQKNQLENTVKK